MKTLLLLSFTACVLMGQPGSTVIKEDSKWIDFKNLPDTPTASRLSYTSYRWTITRAPNGDKTFTLSAEHCTQTMPFYDPNELQHEGYGLGQLIYGGDVQPDGDTNYFCTPLSYANAITLTPITAALTLFYNLAPGKVAHTIVYQTSEPARPLQAPHANFTTVAPATPANPQMIYLDELSDNLLYIIDLTTGATLSKTLLPESALGPFGARPSPTGVQNEVWVANSGLQVSLVDTGAQKVTASIPTPALPISAIPVGIVFTNDGATAIEAFNYQSPDSSGNTAMLAVYDAVNRVLKSTLPLKYPPAAIVMAPDALTVYLLSTSGQITYYDVLSGTADLSVSTFTPGLAGGYNGSVPVFIHPDGTRLLWAVGSNLEVFDLTTHKLTAQFSAGLPTTATSTMQMAQDGATVTFTNTLGNLVTLDTRYGGIVGTSKVNPQSAVYPGPSN